MENNHPPLNTADQRAPAPINLSRRYACDRCRSHKLRCNRDLMTATNSPCQRCRKARAKCTIGSSVRVGLKTGLAAGEEIAVSLESNPPSGANIDRPTDSEPLPSTSPQPGRFTPAFPQQPSPYASSNGQSDPLHLSPMPWLDMIDLNFDDHHTDFDQGPSGIPVTNQAQQENNMSNAPASTYSVAVDPPPSLPHIPSIGYGTSRAPSNQFRDRLPSLGRERSASRSDIGPLENSRISLGSSGLESMIQSQLLLPQTSASWTQPAPAPLSAELRDACIQRLSDLSASLVKDLDNIITCKTASSFLFTPSDKAAAGYLFKALNGSLNDSNAVGRMLAGSEEFLDIMKLLNHAPVIPSRSSTPSIGSYDYFDMEDIASARSGQQSPEERGTERWNLLQEYLGQSNRSGSSISSRSTSCHSISTPFSERRKLPSAATLVILSCYTSLLKIYESVFFVIHHVLECTPTSASSLELPQTVQNFKIDGFMLENHRRLQMKILVQVSKYMLDLIQKSLGGILSDNMFQALLKTLLKEDGVMCSTGDETGTSKIRESMRQVEEMLQ